MQLFESGISTFIKLLIIIGLITMLYMFIMQKVSEQNHKISSMLGLITTMANEIAIVKKNNSSSDSVKNIINLNSSDHLLNQTSNLISVSDDSEEDSEGESDSEEDSDSDDDMDCKNISTTKVLYLNENSLEENLFGQIEQLEHIAEFEDIDQQDPVKDIEQLDNIESSEEILENVLESNITNINSDETTDFEVNGVNYKKLSQPKLRDIIVEKQLLTKEEVSKLKKNDLLKLLE